MARFPSRFAGLSERQARFVLLAFAAVVLASALLSLGGQTAPASSFGDGRGDLVLYQTIIDRLRHGEDYYPVVADELRNGGYALRPVLNFRLPTLATFLAFVPHIVALVMLRLLAAAVVLAWFARLRQSGMRAPHAILAGVVAATGVGLAFNDSALVWHEMWAGLLIALSLAVHGKRTWGWSVALGLCAVLIRELALPLPLIMMALAARERRLMEAGAWLGVVVAFGAAMAVHMTMAAQQLVASDPANGWTAVGGWGFILSTAKWNLLLTAAPMWVNATLVPCAVLGLAGWVDRSAGKALLVTAAWLAAFLFLGRPDNHYWGLMYAPLLALGAALFIPAFVTLVRVAALFPRRPTVIAQDA